MRCLIIIPAYNEEESIQTTLDNLKAVCPQFRDDIVVINDGSTDRTESYCRMHNVKCITLPFNEGLSGAFQTGMRYALELGYDYAVQFDADGQHLPQFIMPMLEKAAESKSDIVIGSRYLEKMSGTSMRKIGSVLIRAAIRITTGKKITDPTSGMRMYGKRMIELFARELNFVPEPDTIAYLIKSGALVQEIPVEMADRAAGASYLTAWKSAKYMIKTVLSILLIQYSRPVVNMKSEETFE